MSDKNWIVEENIFEPERMAHYETVFTQGNGFLGTRGSFEEFYSSEHRSTFAHGVFDDVPVSFTELANLPDWTELFLVLDGESFSMENGELLSYRRFLDLRDGLLTRELRWQSPKGKISKVVFARFISRSNERLCPQKVEITPENYSGRAQVRAGLDGNVSNLNLKHWDWLSQEEKGETICLKLRTKASGITLQMRQNLRCSTPQAQLTAWDVFNHPTQVIEAPLQKGQTLTVWKAVETTAAPFSQEPAPGRSVELQSIHWQTELEAHRKLWAQDWQHSDVVIEGDDEAQLAMRFSIYHLLIAGPRHSERVNIGAKTLSGQGYRGHAFWDTEIFMLPFFTFTQPALARNLLSYRYHNLPGAQEKAAKNGFKGAQFPWESAATGREVTPVWLPYHKDPAQLVRIWCGDIEIHISGDIAYACLQYWKASGDDAFMLQKGAELVLQTAVFWASRLEWNPKAARYELNNVIGPDENHDRIDNNAYTNYMVRWQLHEAACLYRWLLANGSHAASALLEKLQLNEQTAAHWLECADKIHLPFDKNSSLVEQFEGYFKLKTLDMKDFAGRTESIQGILGVEGAAATQTIKQPDVLMLMFLHPELFSLEVQRKNFDYYTPRTDLEYGSSLGPSIQAIMATRLGDMPNAYENFMRAARADLKDVRGNAGDGIHGASAGGLWQAAVFGFAGLMLQENTWKIQPRLPKNWRRLAFKFFWRGKEESVDIRAEDAQ
ncbi:MAG: glycosyl hydrolase family 65 protein [Anaerolineaceae bacterium]|nr:glycosyl hydrolase family 65 protein [Anaerolineaceae bacterium]